MSFNVYVLLCYKNMHFLPAMIMQAWYWRLKFALSIHLFDTCIKGQRLVFWPLLMRDVPFHQKFRPTMAHLLSKNDDCDRLNALAVKTSEKCLVVANRKSTTSFPTRLMRSAYIMHKFWKGVSETHIYHLMDTELFSSKNLQRRYTKYFCDLPSRKR